MNKVAEYGFGGDINIGQTPQMEDEREIRDMAPHDEPGYEPGSSEYSFFYGNGQLHVSPHHSFDELSGHAGVAEDHNGPMAAGTISVHKGNALWEAHGNVSLHGLQRIFKDYTDSVGWHWGGLVNIDGTHFDDSFAPKKSMNLIDNETGEKLTFIRQGSTAWISNLKEDQIEAIKQAGFKIAEYPGGGNMMDRMRHMDPAGEDYELFNNGDPFAEQQHEPDQMNQKGTFRCPNCDKPFDNWSVFMEHRRHEEPEGDIEPVEDGQFPNIDLDKTLPAHYHERNPIIMPLASVKEARRVEGFDLYANLWGYDTDDGIIHYGAFLDGTPVGYASVRKDNKNFDRAEIIMIHSSIEGRGVGSALMNTLKNHYSELVTGVVSSSGERLAKRSGLIEVNAGIYKWSAGQEPKDMLEAPVPIVYDVDKDKIVVGQPGQKTSDIPVSFTPGGIVEGYYEPGGKVVITTMTNMPWTTRHFLDLFYWSHPQMEVTSVESVDQGGKSTKLAKISTTDVGQYIKELTTMDPAAWNSYQALRKAGGHVYVVGGAVRDALMQKQPKDIDLMVTGLPTEHVDQILNSLPGRVDLTGKNFGVYRYKTNGSEVEIALPRKERSTGERRVHFDVDVDHNLSPEDDFLRRDFTANAMGVDLDSGRLVDPYGGSKDIENRILRTTHPSSFKEDPTRLLRALVMNGRYGFNPDEETRKQIGEHHGRLALESADAKQPILEKLLESENPAGAIRLAHETGLLHHIFPEIEQHFNFDQNNPHHNHPLGDHLLNVLENTASQSSDPDLRLAALLHDIGKPASAWTNPETGFNHYYRGADGQGADHQIVGADIAGERLKAIRWPKGRTERIKHLIQQHMFPAFSSAKGARKFLHNVGDEHGDDLLTLRWADQHGKGQTLEEIAARTSVDTQRGLVNQVRSAGEPTSQSALAINGNDILNLGVKPGPEIGVILRQLTNEIIESPQANNRETLLQLAQEYANALPA